VQERDLPLTALRAFAIAARSQSLVQAAEFLGVTHGAVSKQILVLESWLGQSLFARDGRSLRLTPFGRILSERVSEAMHDLVASCDYVRRDRSRKVVSVEAPTTLAMYFLLPRIKEFEAKYTDLSVWVSTRMTNQIPDFARHDVIITRGAPEPGSARPDSSRLLFEEELTVVSAISLLEDFPVVEPADVCHHRFIASTSRPGDWEAWLAQTGLSNKPVEGGHHFDHLFVAMHAVRDGLGSTIAPRLFFNRTESRYGLHCPLPNVTIRGKPCFAHINSPADRESVESFISWLTELCTAEA
jgi:DNA-binding transcriptional LysR family regulator